MRNINEIIIHCSATYDNQDIHAIDINRMHIARGFDKIGYHFFIRLDGTIEQGRKIDEIGAHCYGYNRNSIGICYAGGLKKVNGKTINADTRTPEQTRSLYQLVKILLYIYPDIDNVCGHNDYSNKSCPCFNVHDEFDLFLKQVREMQRQFDKP